MSYCYYIRDYGDNGNRYDMIVWHSRWFIYSWHGYGMIIALDSLSFRFIGVIV
jgi:hypothetical protein